MKARHLIRCTAAALAGALLLGAMDQHVSAETGNGHEKYDEVVAASADGRHVSCLTVRWIADGTRTIQIGFEASTRQAAGSSTLQDLCNAASDLLDPRFDACLELATRGALLSGIDDQQLRDCLRMGPDAWENLPETRDRDDIAVPGAPTTRSPITPGNGHTVTSVAGTTDDVGVDPSPVTSGQPSHPGSGSCRTGANPELGIGPAIAVGVGVVVVVAVAVAIHEAYKEVKEKVETAFGGTAAGSTPATPAPSKGVLKNFDDKEVDPDSVGTPAQTCAEFAALIERCTTGGWKDSECQDFADAATGCDRTIAYFDPEGGCGQAQIDLTTYTPASSTCGQATRPIPGEDPCAQPGPARPDAPPAETGPNADPCNGINPYGYTDPGACVPREMPDLPVAGDFGGGPSLADLLRRAHLPVYTPSTGCSPVNQGPANREGGLGIDAGAGAGANPNSSEPECVR